MDKCPVCNGWFIQCPCCGNSFCKECGLEEADAEDYEEK